MHLTLKVNDQLAAAIGHVSKCGSHVAELVMQGWDLHTILSEHISIAAFAKMNAPQWKGIWCHVAFERLFSVAVFATHHSVVVFATRHVEVRFDNATHASGHLRVWMMNLDLLFCR